MGEQLDSWKAIASYLGREVRTVQRWAKMRQLPVHRIPGGERPRVYALKSEVDAWMRGAGSPPLGRTVSIAVLPFVNLAEAPGNHFFGDGLADDLINELVRVPGLRVIARTSSFACATEQRDVRDIGARLGAAWLVEGSVRRDGRRVRVSAQLVNTRDGGHAWSERYDRDLTDMFAIQDEIARSIAVALKLALTPSPSSSGTSDPVAYDLWVRGRALSQLCTARASAEAREAYEAAIARDPGFARPHFGLADLLFYVAEFGLGDPSQVLPPARAAIERALELDARFGEAHAVLGLFRALLDYDWVGAESAFRRALELSPGSAAVLSRHAWYYLVPRLRLDEAVDEAHRAVILDPLSPFAHARHCLVLVAARDFARACEAGRVAVRLAPELWWSRWFYGTALLAHGRVEEGIRYCQGVYAQIHTPLTTGAMGAVHGLYGERGKALELLHELEAIARESRVPPQAFALAYLGVGDDRVFTCLDQAITAHDPMATHLPSMPLYDRLRDDPRFSLLLGRVGAT